MTCPKCKTENQNGNFCSECGEKLRERCAECGEMKPIGRPTCYKKIYEAQKKRRENRDQELKRRPLVKITAILIICMAGTICMQIISDITRSSSLTFVTRYGDYIFITEIVMIVVFVYLLFARNTKWHIVVDEKFSRKFPLEAEILKKAEGEKK